MSVDHLTANDELGLRTARVESVTTPSQESAVSWGAIIAGGAAAGALSLILITLGTGLGMSSISPWGDDGISAKTLGISTILWLTITQLSASAMAGYLAGRLRTKWDGVDKDEVYFRDTAHGFLAWALWAIVTAVLLTNMVGAIVSSGVQAGATVAGGVASTATAAVTTGAGAAGAEMAKNDSNTGPMAYFVDSLFRKDMNAPGASSAGENGSASAATGAGDAAMASEASRILMNGIRTGSLPAGDVHYLGQIVAQRTGMSQQDAEKRVTDTQAQIQAKIHDAQIKAKDAADKARKASAYAAFWLFLSLLIGAFVASFAATFGGRHRAT